jgi:hypothetical protein
VVTVEGNAAIAAAGALVAHSAAIAAAATTTAAIGAIPAMAATTHTFDIHYYDESLSCSQPGQARSLTRVQTTVRLHASDLISTTCAPGVTPSSLVAE